MLTPNKAVAGMEPEAPEVASCIDASLAGSIGLEADRDSRYSALCVQLLGFVG